VFKAELPTQSRGFALELFYPMYLEQVSKSCFAGDSRVIAPGSHEKIIGGSDRSRKLGDTKTKETGNEIIAPKIKAKSFIVNVAYRYIL